MKKILLTGATGFLGGHLLKLLTQEKDWCSVAIITRCNNENVCSSIEQITNVGDYIDFEEKILRFDPEIVIHLASYLSANDDYEDIDNIIDANITFGTKVLQALSKANVQYFINTGSFAEFYWNDGELDPAYLYSASKTAFRHIVDYYSKKSDFKVINVIPYTIYGEKDKNKKVIDYIIDALDSNDAIGMTAGEQVLDFVHVEDVAEFYLCLLKNIQNITATNESFHVGTGIGTSIKDIAAKIEESTSKKLNISWGEREYRSRDVMRAVASSFKAKSIVGWESKINIEDGINLLLKTKGLI